MNNLREAAKMAMSAINFALLYAPSEDYDELEAAADALEAALAEQLTDEQISDLWHQSGEQPFKFARMLVK